MSSPIPSNPCPDGVVKRSIASERRRSSAGLTWPGRYQATTRTPRACSASTKRPSGPGRHDVARGAVVRRLDPDGVDVPGRDACGRRLGRREHAAVVDVDPGPEPAEDRAPATPRRARRGAAPAVASTDREREDDERARASSGLYGRRVKTMSERLHGARIARSGGRSSVGRALASQARCRGFESHRPLCAFAGETSTLSSRQLSSVASSWPERFGCSARQRRSSSKTAGFP